MSLSILCTSSGTMKFLTLLQGQNDHDREMFAIDSFKAALTVCNQGHSGERTDRTASETGKKNGISVFETRLF